MSSKLYQICDELRELDNNKTDGVIFKDVESYIRAIKEKWGEGKIKIYFMDESDLVIENPNENLAGSVIDVWMENMGKVFQSVQAVRVCFEDADGTHNGQVILLEE